MVWFDWTYPISTAESEGSFVIRKGGADLNIANGVREFGVALAEHTAVVDGNRTMTFAELDDRSSRLGNGMLTAGLLANEPVAVLLGNRMEYPEIAAGLAKAGLPMVPLNPRMTHSEIEYILGHSEARALIADDGLANVAGPALENLGIRLVYSIDGSQLGVNYESMLENARAVDPRRDVGELEPFAYFYTSGTTGKPKGVLTSHRSRCLTFLASALEWGLGPGSRTMAVAPMYHGAGFIFAYSAVVSGGTLVMLRKWDPERMLALIEAERIESAFLVPTHAQMIRSLGSETIERHDLSRLQTLYFNAAPFPFPLKQWLIDALPRVGVHEVYGSTEAGVVTCLRPPHQLVKPGSVGSGWFMTELSVRNESGEDVNPGEIGLLYSRSPYLMNGYLNDEKATEESTTSDGFFTAGDIARVDDDGFAYIVDRQKDLIITGGNNVYPREVEDVLHTHLAVESVAVIGTPSEQWGELVTAVVVLKPGFEVSENQLEAHCRERLASYKLPRHFEFVDHIPTSTAGKILKRELRDHLTVDHANK